MIDGAPIRQFDREWLQRLRGTIRWHAGARRGFVVLILGCVCAIALGLFFGEANADPPIEQALEALIGMISWLLVLTVIVLAITSAVLTTPEPGTHRSAVRSLLLTPLAIPCLGIIWGYVGGTYQLPIPSALIVLPAMLFLWLHACAIALEARDRQLQIKVETRKSKRRRNMTYFGVPAAMVIYGASELGLIGARGFEGLLLLVAAAVWLDAVHELDNATRKLLSAAQPAS